MLCSSTRINPRYATEFNYSIIRMTTGSPDSFCLGFQDSSLHAEWRKTCPWRLLLYRIVRRFHWDRPCFRELNQRFKHKTKSKNIGTGYRCDQDARQVTTDSQLRVTLTTTTTRNEYDVITADQILL